MRHFELAGDLAARHRLLDDDLSGAGRFRAVAVHGRNEEAGPLRGLPQKLLSREARLHELRDDWNEAFPVSEREHVDERREGGGVHSCDVPAHQDQGMTLVAGESARRQARRGHRPEDVGHVHLPGEGPREQPEIGERRSGLERRPARSPSSKKNRSQTRSGTRLKSRYTH